MAYWIILPRTKTMFTLAQDIVPRAEALHDTFGAISPVIQSFGALIRSCRCNVHWGYGRGEFVLDHDEH